MTRVSRVSPKAVSRDWEKRSLVPRHGTGNPLLRRQPRQPPVLTRILAALHIRYAVRKPLNLPRVEYLARPERVQIALVRG